MQASDLPVGNSSQLHWAYAVQEEHDMDPYSSAWRKHQPCTLFCVWHVLPNQLIPL